MAHHILVFAEHQDGKLTRPTWEALAAGQRLAQDLGTTVTAVLLGSNLASLASELDAVAEVLTVDSPYLAQYTADGYALALRAVIEQQKPRFVVFSHTYQVRDFAPKLAVSLDRGLVSDCLGYRNEDGKLIFVRQVFQGKYCADIEFAGEAPYLVSFQAAAFREDAVQRGPGPATVTPVAVELAADAIRAKPGERFREAKQAVDLTQAEIIVAVGRGIKAPENIDLAKKLADALGAELERLAPSVTTVGCPWIGKSAAPGKPWRPSYTWRWESPARFSTWWA